MKIFDAWQDYRKKTLPILDTTTTQYYAAKAAFYAGAAAVLRMGEATCGETLANLNFEIETSIERTV